jgi:hypothetical protein
VEIADEKHPKKLKIGASGTESIRSNWVSKVYQLQET